MKKLFGGLNITWPKLIIFAIITAVYTAFVAILPAAEHTSFKDISISFEWWILFGTVIIMNSKSPVDSALKCFVFFLISQPLIYLIQVPFCAEGWGIMGYYRNWIVWTILTLPMGYIGHYLKKDKIWGLAILAPVMLFLGEHYATFLTQTITWFPHHLLSAIFCVATVIIYPLVIFSEKKTKTIGLILAAVILIAGTIVAVTADHSFYNTSILASDKSGPEYFDSTYTVSLEDESYGNVHIEYEEDNKIYVVYAELTKPGETKLILTSPEGSELIYDLSISKDTYSLKLEK